MQIVIVGAGTVGFELAVQLQSQGHDVSLVEEDGARAASISEKLDVLVVEGNGSSPRALEQAGIRQASMLLAVTSHDEVNILACGLAEQMGVEQRIARIRNHELTSSRSPIKLENLGVTRVINPERVLVRVIDQIARVPDAVEVFAYHDGDIVISRHIIRDNMPVAGKNLIEVLEMAENRQFLAVAIKRDGKTWIPAGDDILQDGDDVTTLFRHDALPEYLRLLDLEDRVPRRAFVAGDSLTAVQLCAALREWIDSVTLLDPDYEHGLLAAEELDLVEVLHGDPSDRDFLREANLSGCDLFVGASERTTQNVMSALLARSEGARQVSAISLEPRSNRLFREIGVDHVISPRRMVSQEIMDLIHRGRFSMELQLRDMDLESLEILAEEGSKITSAPLHKVWNPFKRQAIAGAIIREDKILIPRGDSHVEAGDELIVITQPKTLNQIRRLFKGKK
ncbi:MAG: Trk system potassium transporter TrkA [Candidatus Krumholzibacteria bacterium]|jgi:trk system potassium uptake protein TrkA|nr:Trk system potassium transporter TrkA [Candidatus Krumholzibacteria bacterium]MDP6669631.1 Trk system potassium transporter TrkA [Candidatus Krumholzibacteria bacterium]MDP6797070.1 Trk system potassium transporter TrkA [Candidatus Krumholzibacteria bacterium]MDP7022458.1 Trk system potassium transporter TrkA [Candidatus Krumholzibacteria bacterium]